MTSIKDFPGDQFAAYHELVGLYPLEPEKVTARIYSRPASELLAEKTFDQADTRADNKAAALKWIAGEMQKHRRTEG